MSDVVKTSQVAISSAISKSKKAGKPAFRVASISMHSGEDEIVGAQFR